MKKLLFPVIILSSALFFSCEKEQQLSYKSGDSNLLSKILINGELYKEFSYNDADLITEEKTKFTYTAHSYNRNNQLIASEFYYDPAMYSSSSSVVQEAAQRKEWINPDNIAKSLTQQFEYDDNYHLIKKKYVRPANSVDEYSVYIWDNNRISEQIMYYNNVKSGYLHFDYDYKGNLIKETRTLVTASGTENAGTITEYEYDNMNNPYYAFSNLLTPGIYTNPNNIVRETYTILFEVDSFVDKVQTTETTYEYNDKGYPVRVNGEMQYIYR